MSTKLRVVKFPPTHMNESTIAPLRHAMTRNRCHLATLTSHELMLLALFRAVSSDQQRQLSGLLYRWSCDTQTVLRFRDEGSVLGVQQLDAAVLRPFIDASHQVAGILKRAA